MIYFYITHLPFLTTFSRPFVAICRHSQTFTDNGSHCHLWMFADVHRQLKSLSCVDVRRCSQTVKIIFICGHSQTEADISRLEPELVTFSSIHCRFFADICRRRKSNGNSSLQRLKGDDRKVESLKNKQ